MTTATEKAISERETRSRNKAKKRGIGKYADEAFDLDDYADDGAPKDEAKPTKAAKK